MLSALREEERKELDRTLLLSVSASFEVDLPFRLLSQNKRGKI